MAKSTFKSVLVSFISTLIATLIGVYVAVLISDNQAQKKEVVDTVKQLKTGSSILHSTVSYIDGIEKALLQYKDDEAILASIKSNTEIPYPDFFETIISNDVVSKNVSEFSYEFMYVNILNLRNLASYNSLEAYKIKLQEIQKLIDLEVELLNKNISRETLSVKMSKFQEEIYKNATDDKVKKVIVSDTIN